MSHAVFFNFLFFFPPRAQRNKKRNWLCVLPGLKATAFRLKGFIILMIKLPGDRQIKATSWET